MAESVKVIIGGSVVVYGEGGASLPIGGSNGDILVKQGNDIGVASWKSPEDAGIVAVDSNGKIPSDYLDGALVDDLGTFSTIEEFQTMADGLVATRMKQIAYCKISAFTHVLENYYSGISVIQVLKGSITIDEDGKLKNAFSPQFKILTRYRQPASSGTWSAWEYLNNDNSDSIIELGEISLSSFNDIKDKGVYYYTLIESEAISYSGILYISTINNGGNTFVYQRREEGTRILERNSIGSSWTEWKESISDVSEILDDNGRINSNLLNGFIPFDGIVNTTAIASSTGEYTRIVYAAGGLGTGTLSKVFAAENNGTYYSNWEGREGRYSNGALIPYKDKIYYDTTTEIFYRWNGENLIPTGKSTGGVSGDYIPISQKGVANGVAILDGEAKVASNYLPYASNTNDGIITSEQKKIIDNTASYQIEVDFEKLNALSEEPSVEDALEAFKMQDIESFSEFLLDLNEKLSKGGIVYLTGGQSFIEISPAAILLEVVNSNTIHLYLTYSYIKYAQRMIRFDVRVGDESAVRTYSLTFY